MDTPTRILVCGGGNGAHTLAATAAAMTNVEVNVMTLYSDEAQRWRNILGRDSIVVEVFYNDGSTGKLEGKPRMITKDPAKSMEGVDAIFFVVPAFAHQQYFEAITKYIKPNTIVIGMPGQAGFEFQALKHLKDAAKLCGVISLESLPWACRILEFGRRVQVLGFKDVLGASVIPGKGKYKVSPLEFAQRIMGAKPVLKATQNYIAVNLMAKSIVHPPVLYGKWRNWDGNPLPEPPLFYQGVDDIQADMLTKVSNEVVATAKEIERQNNELDMSAVIHVLNWYRLYYSEQISDDSSLRSCMVTNSAYNGLLHPMKKVEGGYVPDFNFRYTAEDVPFGLVVMKGIAECVGMKTPTLDEVIVWAQEKLGKEYVVGSRLKGKDVGETRAPQAFGFTTINDLCSVL
ncbi:opine dehydrogenase-like [Mya arenaria]|uniref:opine dehydrogenase-like n=1 Tax=Mya arenaria TaxID=6604 RepID=UPI0022E4C9B9|nr:opine dehydrogenase-like [Mya arenaria]XP_052778177.1 opine dehydrogenase-like [Mya arenaria]